MAELHPGRAAMVALARSGRDFHLAQQGIHFGDRQDPAGADRAMAGDGRGDMVELVAQAERSAELGELAGEVTDEAGNVRLAECRGNRADEDRGRPEAVDFEPEVRQLS